MKTIPGGWSELTRVILHTMFVKDQIASTGVQLHIGGKTTTVVISMGIMVADEEALNAMWYIKGASGILPCGYKCSVTNKSCPTDIIGGIASLAARDGHIPDLGTHDVAKLGLRSDADVWAMFDFLEPLKNNELEHWQHLTGLKFSNHCLLYDKALRHFVKPSCIRFDPMHVLVSNGLMNTEFMLVLTKLKQTVKVYFKDVREWEAKCSWQPKSTCWSEVREHNATSHVKSGASETLFQYPLLRQFIIEHFGDEAPEAHIQSFLRLCEITDMYRQLKLRVPIPNREACYRYTQICVDVSEYRLGSLYIIKHTFFSLSLYIYIYM